MIDHRIETFIVLCETKSYTKTAQLLAMTQPGVTQHIQYLEKYYKAQLFSKKGSKLALTEAGEVFYKYCIKIRGYERHVQSIIQNVTAHHPKLALGATLTIGEFVLPHKIGRYTKAHPNVQISLDVDNTQNLLQKLQNGVLDCACIEGYLNKEDFTSHLMEEAPFVALVGAHHPLSEEKNISLEALGEYTLILREKGSGTREILEHSLTEANYPIENFKKTIEVGNMGAIKTLVKEGIGFTMMYEVAAKDEIHQGTLIKLDLEYPRLIRPFHFIYRKDHFMEEMYLAFLNT